MTHINNCQSTKQVPSDSAATTPARLGRSRGHPGLGPRGWPAIWPLGEPMKKRSEELVNLGNSMGKQMEKKEKWNLT